MLFSTTDDEGQPEDLRGIVTTQAYGPSFTLSKQKKCNSIAVGNHHPLCSEGDTLESIAVRYGLQVDTILWENNLQNRSY